MCIYIYMNVCMRMHVCLLNRYKHIYIYIYVCVCVQVCLFTRYMRIYMCVCSRLGVAFYWSSHSCSCNYCTFAVTCPSC